MKRADAIESGRIAGPPRAELPDPESYIRQNEEKLWAPGRWKPNQVAARLRRARKHVLKISAAWWMDPVWMEGAQLAVRDLEIARSHILIEIREAEGGRYAPVRKSRRKNGNRRS